MSMYSESQSPSVITGCIRYSSSSQMNGQGSTITTVVGKGHHHREIDANNNSSKEPVALGLELRKSTASNTERIVITSTAVAACATLSAPEEQANVPPPITLPAANAPLVPTLSFPSLEQEDNERPASNASQSTSRNEPLKTPPPRSMELQTIITTQNIAPAPPAPSVPLPVVPVDPTENTGPPPTSSTLAQMKPLSPSPHSSEHSPISYSAAADDPAVVAAAAAGVATANSNGAKLSELHHPQQQPQPHHQQSNATSPPIPPTSVIIGLPTSVKPPMTPPEVDLKPQLPIPQATFHGLQGTSSLTVSQSVTGHGHFLSQPHMHLLHSAATHHPQQHPLPPSTSHHHLPVHHAAPQAMMSMSPTALGYHHLLPQDHPLAMKRPSPPILAALRPHYQTQPPPSLAHHQQQIVAPQHNQLPPGGAALDHQISPQIASSLSLVNHAVNHPTPTTPHGRASNVAHKFQCELCGKSLASKNVYQLHLRSHSGEKPFSCPLCGNSFSQKTSLTRHMRSHTGERPHPCPICDKRFADKERIKIHMRTHTGEKPFSCSQCGKAFSQKSTVKRHMSVHTGEKPYKCIHCGKGFANRGNLTAHTKTHAVGA